MFVKLGAMIGNVCASAGDECASIPRIKFSKRQECTNNEINEPMNHFCFQWCFHFLWDDFLAGRFKYSSDQAN